MLDGSGLPFGVTVEWCRPWTLSWTQVGAGVLCAIEAGQSVSGALNDRGAEVTFVPQAALPDGVAYEQFIFERRQVPTRDNLHDFFNGLCWLRFPQAKLRLNHLQGAEIARQGVQNTRGPLRDALTLFDENAALLQAPEPLWQALLAREWQRLFIELRPLWSQARLVLFGHALLEKLVAPYKSITAHVYAVPVPAELTTDDQWDAWLAGALTADGLRAKPFTPLPVLGVPGWWPAQDEAFYLDTQVFRPARHAVTADAVGARPGMGD